MKKTLIYSIIAIVIIVLGSLLFFTYPGRSLVFGLFSYSNCGSQFNNAFEKAVTNRDYNFCKDYTGDIKWGKDIGYGVSCTLNKKMGIRKNDFQDSCLGAMAYETKDIEFCKTITGESNKGSCVLDVVWAKNDTSYCNILDKTNTYYDICIDQK